MELKDIFGRNQKIILMGFLITYIFFNLYDIYTLQKNITLFELHNLKYIIIGILINNATIVIFYGTIIFIISLINPFTTPFTKSSK